MEDAAAAALELVGGGGCVEEEDPEPPDDDEPPELALEREATADVEGVPAPFGVFVTRRRMALDDVIQSDRRPCRAIAPTLVANRQLVAMRIIVVTSSESVL